MDSWGRGPLIAREKRVVDRDISGPRPHESIHHELQVGSLAEIIGQYKIIGRLNAGRGIGIRPLPFYGDFGRVEEDIIGEGAISVVEENSLYDAVGSSEVGRVVDIGHGIRGGNEKVERIEGAATKGDGM